MIERAHFSRFDRMAIQGRTGPILGAVETYEGEEFETFIKLSSGCDQGVTNLGREVVAACLAADLGLPVPRPWLVEISDEIIPAISNTEAANRIRASVRVAFGSTRVPEFSVWAPGSRLTDAMRAVAAGILLFDAIIQNPDRRVENPNCLVRGDSLRIIDHELAFTHRMMIGWRPPWVAGGLNDLETPGRHIMVSELKGVIVDFQPIKARWTELSDARLQQYADTIPLEWAGAKPDIDAALQLIAGARDNIDACIAELERVLR